MIVYETFSTVFCELTDIRQFVSDVVARFTETELAMQAPPAGKLVVPLAPSVDCYAARADNYQVEVFNPEPAVDWVNAIDWAAPQLQILSSGFDANAPVSELRIGVGYVGTGVDPVHKARSWQPSVGLTLNGNALHSSDRARMLGQLVCVAGFEAPQVRRENDIAYLHVPAGAGYGLAGLRPDLNTGAAVADPNLLMVPVDKAGDSAPVLAQKLITELGVGSAVDTAFSFQATDAAHYDALKTRFERLAGAAESVWKVKPRICALSEAAQQALNGSGDGAGLDVLPLLEFKANDAMHTACAIRRDTRWQIVVGSYQRDRMSQLQSLLSPFVNGWAKAD